MTYTVETERTSLTLGLKETWQLSAGVVASDGSSVSQKLTYASSKPAVVRVTGKGKLTARAKGKAVITITSRATGAKTAVRVTVKAAPKKLTVSPASVTLKRGKTRTLTVSFNKGAAAMPVFTSSNKKIASVDASGVITAKKKGTCYITVKTYNGLKQKIKVTVR